MYQAVAAQNTAPTVSPFHSHKPDRARPGLLRFTLYRRAPLRRLCPTLRCFRLVRCPARRLVRHRVAAAPSVPAPFAAAAAPPRRKFVAQLLSLCPAWCLRVDRRGERGSARALKISRLQRAPPSSPSALPALPALSVFLPLPSPQGERGCRHKKKHPTEAECFVQMASRRKIPYLGRGWHGRVPLAYTICRITTVLFYHILPYLSTPSRLFSSAPCLSSALCSAITQAEPLQNERCCTARRYKTGILYNCLYTLRVYSTLFFAQCQGGLSEQGNIFNSLRAKVRPREYSTEGLLPCPAVYSCPPPTLHYTDTSRPALLSHHIANIDLGSLRKRLRRS